MLLLIQNMRRSRPAHVNDSNNRLASVRWDGRPSDEKQLTLGSARKLRLEREARSAKRVRARTLRPAAVYRNALNDDNRFLPFLPHLRYVAVVSRPLHPAWRASLVGPNAPRRSRAPSEPDPTVYSSAMGANDFSLRALYAALDEERRVRGLSWAQATREMNRQPARSSVHRLSPSTVTRPRPGAVAEGDGVLQMLLWLKRTPESFVHGHQASGAVGTPLPDVPVDRVLRFDTRKLYAALDAQRVERHLTWAQVAQEVDLSVSSLTHLAKGGRTAFPQVMRMVTWVARPAAHFMRSSEW